jgi:predicted DNA-binding antitoxin AbrB/MazE fold protein
MTIEATYRDGAFYPVHPISLPENTRVEVRVPAQLSREEIIAMRPKSPKITVEEFDRIIRENSVSVGSLPADFSREDIYSDHD